MKAVVQRVSSASVVVEGQAVGAIESGLLALVAVVREDTAEDVARMARKLCGLRVFPSGGQSYALDLRQTKKSLLLVSNFTVAADTTGGRRPSLSPAMPPAEAKPVFDALIAAVRAEGIPVETGEFGAEMKVQMVNEGPLTVLIDTKV